MSIYARMSSGGLVCPVCDSTNVSVVIGSEKRTLGREGRYTKVTEKIMHCMNCWSLKEKEVTFLLAGEQSDKFYTRRAIETLHRELQKDKQELQDKISSRIAGLLLPPLPHKYINPTNTSQLRLDISAVINEEFRKFEEKMNRRFGVNTKDKEVEKNEMELDNVIKGD